MFAFSLSYVYATTIKQLDSFFSAARQYVYYTVWCVEKQSDRLGLCATASIVAPKFVRSSATMIIFFNYFTRTRDCRKSLSCMLGNSLPRSARGTDTTQCWLSERCWNFFDKWFLSAVRHTYSLYPLCTLSRVLSHARGIKQDEGEANNTPQLKVALHII